MEDDELEDDVNDREIGTENADEEELSVENSLLPTLSDDDDDDDLC